MQLFSLIVSLTSVVVIASGRCPSKSLQNGKPENLLITYYSTLLHYNAHCLFLLQVTRDIRRMETAFPSIQFNWNEGIVSGIVQLIDLSKLDSIMTLSSQSLTDFPQGLSMFGLRIPPTLQQPRLPSYRLPAQILVAFQVYNEILPAVYLSRQAILERNCKIFSI